MSAEEILSAVERVTGMPLAAIRSRRQGDRLPQIRALIALVMRDELQSTQAQITAALGRTSPTGTYLLVRAERLLRESDEFQGWHGRVLNELRQREAA